MPKTWYYCEQCHEYFTSKKQLEECLRFNHDIKKRTPLEMRIIHKALPYGEPNILHMTIDGLEWNIGLRFAIFKNREYNGIRRTLDMPLSNCVAIINHLHNTNFTVSDLTKAVELAIRNSVYQDYGKGNAKIILYVEDGQIKPITLSTLTRLRENVEVEVKAKR